LLSHILVIDDQKDTLELLQRLFRAEGYTVDAVPDGARAKDRLEADDYDVVFTDLRLGYPYDGLEVLELVKRLRPRAQVVIMTAFSSVESSLLAMKGGAYDYITKPFKPEEVLLLARRAAEKASLEGRVRALEKRLESNDDHGILGSSPAMSRVMALVAQVARTDATVLITGESGTGKELVARAIHNLSPRAGKPFVAVNCGAIPESLQESEFFGHVRGAFTGAVKDKAGLFAEAHRGTLFLDEVGETTLTTQVKLLRFLQSGEIRKVGENLPRVIDARLVAATNRDLVQMVDETAFREDLYYRLNIVALELPPLREREGDIELLAVSFLGRCAKKLGNSVRSFSDAAMARLRGYHWPGNVRELENAVERAVTLARGPIVQVEDLPRFDRPPKRRASDSQGLSALTTAELEPVSSEWHEPETSSVEIAPESPPAGPRERRPAPWAYGEMPDADAVVAHPEALRAVLRDRFPSLDALERQHIEAALELFEGSRTRAADALGISKATLWRKLKRYGLEAEEEA
jgi:two-component system response regulator HydG